MESLSERNERKRYEEAMKKQKRNRIIIAVVVVLLLAVVVVSAIDSQINRDYNGYQVEKKFDRKDSNTVKYISYNGKVLKYSRDGISELDDAGKVVWTGSYDMKKPSIAYCGNYVAVADITGKEIYVYNRTNSTDIKKIETVLPIVKVDIAEQGVVAAVLEDTDSNEINIYDPFNISQQLLVSVPTNVETDGFPVDVSISNDGKRMVTNFINISNGCAKTSVNFYNFDEVGKNSVNRIVGARDFEQTIVAKVEFLNNETVCAYTENGFSLYSMKEVPKDIYEETFDKPVKSVFTNDKYIGVVLDNSGEIKQTSRTAENEKQQGSTKAPENTEVSQPSVDPKAAENENKSDTSEDKNTKKDEMDIKKEDKKKSDTANNSGDNEKYELKIFNIKGKLLLDTNISYDYDTVSMGNEEVIFYSGLECYIMRINGTSKFHYTFDKNIEYFLSSSAKERYYVIDEKEISKIKLTMR